MNDIKIIHRLGFLARAKGDSIVNHAQSASCTCKPIESVERHPVYGNISAPTVYTHR